MKKKILFLISLLCLSFARDIASLQEQEFQKFICRCECFSVDYMETCLIIFLILAFMYKSHKLHKSELRQRWIQTELNRYTKEENLKLQKKT